MADDSEKAKPNATEAKPETSEGAQITAAKRAADGSQPPPNGTGRPPLEQDRPTPGAQTASGIRGFLLSETMVRFCKYAVLLSLAAVGLKFTFDCYSYYVARRSIDAELQAKNISSLESLVIARERNRDAIVALYETRCVERDIMALYWVLDGLRAPKNELLKAAAQDMFKAKTAATDNLKTFGQSILTPQALDKLTGAEFSLGLVDIELTKPANQVDGFKPDDPRVKQLYDHWSTDKAAYEKAAKEHERLLAEAVRISGLELSVSSVKALEGRLSRLKAQTEADKQRTDAMTEVLSRYDTWTWALAPKGTLDQLVDDMVFENQKAIFHSGSKHVDPSQMNCEAVGKYRKGLDDLKTKEDEWEKATWAHLLEPTALYRRFLLRFFEQAPAAQTLFVTLLIGGLGALTLNVLRLSKVGWWARHEDPRWGEIIIGPFLGALAAFGIYLVGSAGLLLTSDVRNGPSSLSAAFIGLLGFVSGLLYDEAFGRVRRVGSAIFSGDKPDGEATARPEDIALARVLQGAGATLIASLVAKRQLGLRLMAESEFTFVVPSDLALSNITLQWWTDMNDTKKPTFDDWFRRHHASKKLVAHDATGTPPPAMAMDDGKSLPFAAAGAGLKIGNVEVVKPDVMWEKGVIHVVSSELPTK